MTDQLNQPAAPDRGAWDAAFAAFKAAEATADAFGKAVDPLHDQYRAECEKVPHVTFRPDPHTGRSEPVSTADVRFVAQARSLVKDVAEGRCRLDPVPDLTEHFELCQQVVEADNTRGAEIQRIDERIGYSAAEAAHDAAVDAMVEARDVLVAMPAPDGDALLWKLDRLFFSDHVWTDDYVSCTIADTRRMLASGQAQ